MGSSNLFFELQGRVLLLPISTNLHRAAGILLVEATFVVDSGGIVHLGVSRQFRRALAAVSCGEAIACCQATSVTDVVWVHLHVRISNKFCRFCNGPINALVEPTAQFHAIDQLVLLLSCNALFRCILRSLRPTIGKLSHRPKSLPLALLLHLLPVLLLELGLLVGNALESVEPLALLPCHRKSAAKTTGRRSRLRLNNLSQFPRTWFCSLRNGSAFRRRLESVLNARSSTILPGLWTVVFSQRCDRRLPGRVSKSHSAAS